MAFASLVDDGTLVTATVVKPNGQTYAGWRVCDVQERVRGSAPRFTPFTRPDRRASASAHTRPAPYVMRTAGEWAGEWAGRMRQAMNKRGE